MEVVLGRPSLPPLEPGLAGPAESPPRPWNDAALAAGGSIDPFEEPVPLGKAQQQRLDALLDRGVNPAIVERLGDYLSQAPQEAALRLGQAL